MTRCEVLIIGAGPTGLVLALWLTRQGVKVRIVDKTREPGTTSRALAVQARTLELYGQLDLAEEVVRRGHETPGVNLWVGGRRAARVSLRGAGLGVTPFPFLFIFPQDEHEALLIARLGVLGVAVERETTLIGFENGPTDVSARLRGPDGGETVCQAAWLAGCDGAGSTVRETLGVDYPGGTYRQLFYVADVEADGPVVNGDLHIALDDSDFLGVFPLAGEGRARLIGTVRGDRADGTLKFEDVGDRALNQLRLKIRRVNWFSTYHVHHRVAARFRQGRAFLLGDAAHIHSPAGAQGMNTGIGDAINLAWKLAAVLGKRAPDTLLDTYQAERIGFARRLVATTDRGFSFATAPGALARLVRTRLAPLLIPAATRVPAVRGFLFRTVSQLNLNYRGGPLSQGRAGRVRGGDRLPWVCTPDGDNLTPAMVWQAHVYGVAGDALTAWLHSNGLPLRVFRWRPEHGKAGLAQNALYLLRPDSYVALADPAASPTVLARYCTARGIDFTPPTALPPQFGEGRDEVRGGALKDASPWPRPVTRSG